MPQANNDRPLHQHIKINGQLELKALKPSDAEPLFQLVDQSRDYLGEYLPWVEDNTEVSDSKDFIKDAAEKRKNGIGYSFGIFKNGKLVGHISLMGIKNEDKPPHIGYWIAKSASGQDITTKATEAITNFALNTLDLNKVVIRAEPRNIASNKIAKKLGYQYTGSQMHEKHQVKLNIWEKSSNETGKR